MESRIRADLELWNRAPHYKPPSPWPNLKPAAQRIMEFAQQAALDFTHNYLDTEHLLLGLLRHRESDAWNILTALGVDKEELAAAVRLRLPVAPWMQPIHSLPLTGLGRRVMERAAKEAQEAGQPLIGSAQILLALTTFPHGKAAAFLTESGLSEEQIRYMMRKLKSVEA